MALLKARLLTTAGFVMLGVGGLGIVLPLIPTTPFVLAAAACFSRSSPRFERWLTNHPVVGQPLRDWREARAISTRSKAIAIATMAVGFAVLMASGTHAALQVTVAAILLTCATFILSRPSRRPDRR